MDTQAEFNAFTDRGALLKRRFFDAAVRIPTLGLNTNVGILKALSKAYMEVEECVGHISDSTKEVNMERAKHLYRKSKRAFEYDIEAGYGLDLLSMYLESLTLPGEDAAYVCNITKNSIALSLKFRDGQ